jgi:hypothetical protein
MSADNDHDHLHRERNRAQKLFPHSKARRVGLTPLRNPNHEDDDDTQKSDDEGSGNRRSLQPASARPTRAGSPSEASDLRFEIY